MTITSSITKRRARSAAIFAVTALAFLPCGDSTVAALPSPPSHGAHSFGANFPGITGLGTADGSTLIATPIDTTNLAGKTIKQVAAGEDHSLLLAADGTVFAFGSNALGETGLGITSGNTLVATPINTTNLTGKRITQVAAGVEYSLLLADDGTVFSFGFNGAGRTGLGTAVGNTSVATPIDMSNLAGKWITQVAAGRDHSLLLAGDGTVFAFGSNRRGQTGLGVADGETLIATEVELADLGDRKITQVAAGWDHSVLLADDGTVFSSGYNAVGRTGQGLSTGNTLVATQIDMTFLAGQTIVQVAAGSEHSLLLSDDATVFSFGSNSYGQTGRGTTVGATLVATPISPSNYDGKMITDVSAGEFHSLLLANDGTVFSFGDNSHGKTGLGTGGGSTLVATPINTTNLEGLRATSISAGRFHSLLVAVPEPAGATLLVVGGLLSFIGWSTVNSRRRV